MTNKSTHDISSARIEEAPKAVRVVGRWIDEEKGETRKSREIKRKSPNQIINLPSSLLRLPCSEGNKQRDDATNWKRKKKLAHAGLIKVGLRNKVMILTTSENACIEACFYIFRKSSLPLRVAY